MIQFNILHRCHLIFHSVPSNEPNKKKWIDAITQHQEFDYYVQTFHICNEHFLPTDIKTSGKRKTVISGIVPSIFPVLIVDNIHAAEIIEVTDLQTHSESDSYIPDTIEVLEVNTNEVTLDNLHDNGIPNENETWCFAENLFDVIDETNMQSIDNSYDTNPE